MLVLGMGWRGRMGREWGVWDQVLGLRGSGEGWSGSTGDGLQC